VGVGLAFLAREGLSFATLRELPEAVDPPDEGAAAGVEEHEAPRARAGVSG